MKHKVESISFAGRHLKLRADGHDYRIDLSVASEKLARASKIERNTFRVSPSGYGIHWPLLDEDLTVDGLIRVASGNEALRSA